MENENTINVKIEKGLSLSGEQSRILSMFAKYCHRALGLNGSYSCYLTKTRKEHDISTTAVCNYGKKKILIFSKGRLLADVLRSIAHESTHLRQFEHGKSPDENYLHFSSELEDNANELAGKLLNSFAGVISNDAIYNEYIREE